MLKRFAQSTKSGLVNSAAMLAAQGAMNDENQSEEDVESAPEDQEEVASAEGGEETSDEEDGEETSVASEDDDGDDKNEDTSVKASAVNAETKRVLGIVGSSAGLANPALAIELAGVDEDGHRMSAKRATSLLQSAGASPKKTKTLAGKVAGHSGGLAPDSEAAADTGGASFNAQMKRKNAAAISLR